MKTTAVVVAPLFALMWGSSLQAQFSAGTWVQTAPMKGFTMTVEECCSGGRRLIFHMTLGPKTQTISTESADRKTLTVENEFIEPASNKMTETYVRK